MDTGKNTAFCNTPLGVMEVQATEKHILSVQFIKEEPGEAFPLPHHPVLKQCILQLQEYFAGTRKTFDLPLLPEGTEFQRQVWEVLRQIEFGKQYSYLQQSKKLGNVKAIRAVASANGKNPIAVIIPCHRVVGSDNSLVGFSSGLWRKKWLLEHEAKLAAGVQTLF
jgi:methylated-DNA-[protein]-cysteine S-methyltransferase